MVPRIRQNLGVAQFGSVLEWGSRGREFKSLHSDQVGAKFTLLLFLCLKTSDRFLSFSKKGAMWPEKERFWRNGMKEKLRLIFFVRRRAAIWQNSRF